MHSCRLFVKDPLTGFNFLIDSGADLSILPHSRFRKLPVNPHCQLRAANNSVISTYGDKMLTLSLGFPRKYPHCFLVADVKHPILGADFLRRFGLLIDLKNHRLLESKTCLSVAAVGRLDSDCLSSFRVSGFVEHLSKKFPLVFSAPDYNAPVVHSVVHRIDTKGELPSCTPRRLPPDRLKIAKKEFEEMVRVGICRPSNSPCSSPLLMVAKGNNQWRPCGDYRRLNHVTIPDRYGIPHIHSFADHLHGKKIFSKIDMVKAFHMIPVDPRDVHKTAISTPFGLFEFVRMGFGFRNASQTFQRFMNQVTQGLDFVFVYIDDVLVASSDEKQHLSHLDLLFQRLSEFGVNVNRSKCVFGVNTLDFLGHTISSAGISPTEEKVRAIREYPVPVSRKQLKRFIGMVNYYHRFIPMLSEHLQPLYDTESDGKSVRAPLVWSEECQRAFENTKSALAEVTLLNYLKPDGELELVCDASNLAIGAVLQQRCSGVAEPLMFFSRKLKESQKHYSTYDKELLAIYAAVKHFQYMLEGRPFVIITDHKPLQYAFSTMTERSPIQKRYLSFISQFSSTIVHLAGSQNVVADALSRPNCDVVSKKDWLVELVGEQKSDLELTEMMSRESKSFKLEPVRFPDFLVVCETSQGRHRPFVPKSIRQQLFNSIHDLSHPGIKATRRMITDRYFWPSMNVDIGNWVRACDSCLRSKVGKHVKTIPENIPIPHARFSHLHMDIVGPLPRSGGYQYLLTMVDRFTRWPEAYPMEDMTTETIAITFVREYVPRFGVPDVITTDRGRQFESELFRQLTSLLGICRIRTSAYHPQGNGLVERFHRTLKTALKCQAPANDWVCHLPLVLLGLRATLKEDLDASPAELVYGQPLKLPGDFFATPDLKSIPSALLAGLRENMRNLLPKPTRSNREVRFHVPNSLANCTHVYVRVDRHKPGLTPPYEGPFAVRRRLRHSFVIDRAGRSDSVNINRLKPAPPLED